MSQATFYLTTAIPYVNAQPHIGHALELVQADVVARYHRLIGQDTYFLSGADENSLKNVRAAEQAGISTQQLCDRNAGLFQNVITELNISIDQFIRTSSAEHHRGAQALWQACRADDIYKKTYRGFYCVGCELFYSTADLRAGKCPEHDTVPEIVEEENYFFRLSAYQEPIRKLISGGELQIIPQFRKQEMLSFIAMGLDDFSISRSVERSHHWGVPVPDDPSQVMYVWFDALSNYITALGYGTDQPKRFKQYWPAAVHMIGKGITRFHAIYWPAMLLSAGLPLPKTIFVHGYVSVAGQKMSKSIGNVVDPLALIHSYGADAVRYYLLREIPSVEDGDFSEEKFIDRYNADLANDLGNLVSRVSTMVERYCNGVVPAIALDDIDYDLSDVQHFINQYRFNDALDQVWKIIRLANKMVDDEKPWELFAQGNYDRLERVVVRLVVMIQDLSLALEPFLPAAAGTIQSHFSKVPLTKLPALFPRIL